MRHAESYRKSGVSERSEAAGTCLPPSYWNGKQEHFQNVETSTPAFFCVHYCATFSSARQKKRSLITTASLRQPEEQHEAILSVETNNGIMKDKGKQMERASVS